MKAKLALVTLICVSFSGCATVDLANVGGTKTATVSSDQSDRGNVVERAASKLYTAFTSQGWVQNKSRKRVQSTASVLLRGLDTSSGESPLSDYAQKSLSLSQMRQDIKAAENHVNQTTKAAEVYLAMAADQANLREELASLQKALISSREAELVFKDALPEEHPELDPVFQSYVAAVDALRDVTDAFGDRVRSTRTMTSALGAEIN